MTDRGLPRRVPRLENEVESICELIDDFRSETRRRFDSLDARLTGSDARLDRVETTLNAWGGRFRQIETTLMQILHRLPESA